MNSSRVEVAKLAIWLSFIFMTGIVVFAETKIAVQATESIGYFLSTIGIGFFGAKAAEYNRSGRKDG